MRRMLLLTALLSVILPACAAASPAPAAIAPQGPAPTQPASAPTEAVSATAPAIKTEFTPTDPATVNLAAGKPQFVEFFAFW